MFQIGYLLGNSIIEEVSCTLTEKSYPILQP